MAKSTIALLILLIGLVGVYQFALKDKPVTLSNNQEVQSTPEPAQKVLDFDAGQVQEVVWQFADISHYGDIKKGSDGKWTFVKPATVTIDQTKAEAFITSLMSLSGSPRIPLSDTMTLTSVGMEPAKQFVTFTMQDGSKKQLRIGDDSLDGSQVYVHLDGTDYVTLVYSYQLDEVNKVPTDLEFRPDESPSPMP